MATTQDLQAILKERFAELPPPVQKAIMSEDVQKHLRELAATNKLHLDQWEKLENEVMMTLFGVNPFDELQANIKKEVGVSDEVARTLTADISRVVFEPIRQELERQLEHPEAKAKEASDVEAARTHMLAGNETKDNSQYAQDIGQKTDVHAETPSPSSTAPASTQPPLPQVKPAGEITRNDEAIGGTSIEIAKPPTSAPPTPPAVQPATPPPPPPTEKAVRAPLSSTYQAGEPSTTRKNVHDDPYREAP